MHSFVQWFLFCLYGLPPQSLRDTFPKGAPFGAAAKFPATAKSRPLGEGGIAVGDDGRGVPRRAALSQKAALQMPFPSMTPPVKMRLERSAELVGAKPLHLLTQTALPLKSPTGAFIAALRSANAVTPNAKF